MEDRPIATSPASTLQHRHGAIRRTCTVARVELRRALLRPASLAELAVIALGMVAARLRFARFGGDGGSDFDVALALATIGFVVQAMFTAPAVGLPVIEDGERRVRPLLLATPLRPREYAAGKFLGALGGRLVCLGVLWCCLVLALGRAPDRELLLGLALLGLPPLLLVAGLAFLAGSGTGSRVLVFGIGTVAAVVAWFVFWSWTPVWLDPALDAVLCWLDPSGYRWLESTFYGEARGRSYYATTAIDWSPAFVASRVAIGGAGLAAAAFAIQRCRGDDEPARWRSSAEAGPGSAQAAAPHGTPRPAAPPPAAAGRVGVPPPATALRTVAVAEYRALLSSPGMGAFAVLLATLILFSSLNLVGAFDAPLLLTAGNAVTHTLPTVAILLSLMAICYTVEALGRERACGLAELYGTSPARPAWRLAGKLLAVVAMAATVLVFLTALHAIATWIQGAVAFEVEPFLVGYGVGVLPPVVLWTSVAFACHAVTRSRAAALALACAGMAATFVMQFRRFDPDSVFNWATFGVNRWSDLGSMSANAAAAGGWLARLLGFAVVFAGAGFLAGRSPGTRDRFGRRVALALAWTIPTGLATGLAVGATAAGDHEFGYSSRSTDGVGEFTLERLDLDLEIDPRTGAFRSAGQLALRRHAAGRLVLWGVAGWRSVDWTVDGGATHPAHERSGPISRFRDAVTVYDFAEATALADELVVGFVVDGDLSASSPWSPYFVRPAGVVLAGSQAVFMPGLTEPDAWRMPTPGDDDEHGLTEPLFGNRSPFVARVRLTSPAEYTLNTVGELLEERVADGRRTRSFATSHPVVALNVVGARYAVRRGELAEVYYHPGHAYNVETMLDCLERGRALFSAWFWPYPWRDLRLNEFPGHVTYAQGFATNIHFSESIGFLARPDPRLNLPFMVTAHELAHQWWGNLVVPGRGPGGNVISEGLAHFSAILLTAACRSPRERIELCKRFEQHYLELRDVDGERPLGEADQWDHALVYDKGGWVFWMLLQQLGRDRMFAGLREFIAEYRDNPDHPLPPDLLGVLRRHAPDPAAFDRFVAQWFDAVVLPRFELADVRVAAAGDGFTVHAALRNAGTGRVEVGVAAMRGRRFDPAGQASAELRRADVTVVVDAGGSAPIELRCDFEPDRLEVDPDALVLQAGRSPHRL